MEQETELRLEFLTLLDDVETGIIKKQYDVAREDIQEYREYLKLTTIIDNKKSSDGLKETLDYKELM